MWFSVENAGNSKAVMEQHFEHQVDDVPYAVPSLGRTGRNGM
jgi:hypothetical protein